MSRTQNLGQGMRVKSCGGMVQFLFTESSQWVVERQAFSHQEPANTEPHGFKAERKSASPGARYRKYELVGADGVQKAFLTYREKP
jgi:hypothetical protein